MVFGVTPGDIDRPRLTRAIRDTPPGGLCLVVAPHGYGASTAVRHALRGEAALWVEVEPGQSLGEALRSALDIPSADTAGVRAALASRPVGWVVLDGLTEDPPSEDIKALIEVWPESVRFVVTGCVALDRMVRWPMDTTLIAREQLAFTSIEARALLEQAGVTGRPAQVEAAVEWCEGWPLALKVAAARLRHHSGGEPDAWIVGEGADAVVSPWLDSLDEDLREFLMTTALLDELEVGSTNAVRGSDDASRRLAELTRRPGLLWRLPVDSDGVIVWRRHRLLTEVLRARTAGELDRREAHERAARWYEDQGRVEPAVFHLLEAGRGADAGALLRDHEGELLSVGDARRTLGWYRRLTPQGWTESAEHWFRLGWGHMLTGNP